MAAELSEALELTLEKLKAKRDRLVKRMEEDGGSVKSLTFRGNALIERLNKVTKRMNNRIAAKREYEKTIMETEGAYAKIVDSSASLLSMLTAYIGNDDSDADDIIAGKNMKNEKIGGTMELIRPDGQLNIEALGVPQEIATNAPEPPKPQKFQTETKSSEANAAAKQTGGGGGSAAKANMATEAKADKSDI